MKDHVASWLFVKAVILICIFTSGTSYNPCGRFIAEKGFWSVAQAAQSITGQVYQQSTSPPSEPVRLIFIHHSTGENWLSDDNGKLGSSLRDNNYFVSDTNYGWGPDDLDVGYDKIGDHTDLGNWYNWFRGPHSEDYLNSLYAEAQQNSGYSRLDTNPGGENEIIMFKSCFPNSNLQGNPDDAVPPISSNPLRGQDAYSEYHTIANAKGIYTDLLEYFRTRQDKLFIVITAPPLSDPTNADNARDFNNWLVYEWLKDYPYSNVFVFDFYNVLTTNGGTEFVNDLNRSNGNHHRWWDNAVQHKTDGDTDVNPNISEYATSFNDDHPNKYGNLKATGEFVPLLNLAYAAWEEDSPQTTTTTSPVSTTTTTIDSGGNGGEEPCVIDELYGKYSKKAELLRSYRDNTLNKTVIGQKVIRLYYILSPMILKCMECSEAVKDGLQATIDKVIYLLQQGMTTAN